MVAHRSLRRARAWAARLSIRYQEAKRTRQREASRRLTIQEKFRAHRCSGEPTAGRSLLHRCCGALSSSAARAVGAGPRLRPEPPRAPLGSSLTPRGPALSPAARRPRPIGRSARPGAPSPPPGAVCPLRLILHPGSHSQPPRGVAKHPRGSETPAGECEDPRGIRHARGGCDSPRGIAKHRRSVESTACCFAADSGILRAPRGAAQRTDGGLRSEPRGTHTPSGIAGHPRGTHTAAGIARRRRYVQHRGCFAAAASTSMGPSWLGPRPR